jgi:hypothetical protein
MNESYEDLTALFRRLNAPNPEGWARSQVEEGINQLHRYLFLRQAWSLVVRDDDHAWIDAQIASAERQSSAPFSGTGLALRKLLDTGADRQLLTDLVRAMQAELLFGLCYLLEDPGIEEEELSHVGWRLVEADERGEPNDVPIACLHESVLETDPSTQRVQDRSQ